MSTNKGRSVPLDGVDGYLTDMQTATAPAGIPMRREAYPRTTERNVVGDAPVMYTEAELDARPFTKRLLTGRAGQPRIYNSTEQQDDQDALLEMAGLWALGLSLRSAEDWREADRYLNGGEYYPHWRSQMIHRAIGRLVDAGAPLDATALGMELNSSGELAKAGGMAYVSQLGGYAAGDLGYWAAAIHDAATKRRSAQFARGIMERSKDPNVTPEDIEAYVSEYREAERQHAERHPDRGHTADGVSLTTGGASFFQDVPGVPPAVWGRGGEVLWAEGEALIITGPQGVGKTTLAHQLIRARIGLQPDFLGYPVAPGKRVLLLAMDRPSQTRRAGARIFAKDDPAYLNERLVVWSGPPPADMAKDPDVLARMCRDAGADTVIVDSLKDAAVGLSEDAVGAGYNRARQKALAEGVQVVELHHPVKNGVNGTAPKTIADVYGSTWITSGAGSVISLWGQPGDPVVEFRHLKQPMDEVGPFHIAHDGAAGISQVQHGCDVFALAASLGPEGLTAKAYATALYDEPKPSPAQIAKAARKLDKLAADQRLTKIPGKTAPPTPATYFPAIVAGA